LTNNPFGSITINPIKTISGRIRVPGDKSISHRALLFAAIANGQSKIFNLAEGLDVQSTSTCLRQLGVQISSNNLETIVTGVGLTGLKQPESVLDAGNSGTTLRLLTGILTAQPFNSIISGDESLQKRPMKRIIDPLRLMGAEIESNNLKPPLHVRGRQIRAHHYQSPVASGQVKSCLLLAGLFSSGLTSVTEPALSRDHTERLLPCFGVEIFNENLKTSLRGPALLKATDIKVPGDISSAAFFMVAASLLPNSHLTILDVGLNPTRTGLITALKKMGAKIQLHNQRQNNNEPVADITIHSSKLKAVTISGNEIPGLIDEIPVLAVAASQAEGETIIRDAAELRVKEADRIETVAANLRCMGINLETREDGFSIRGPQKLKGAQLKSYGDHRIAMAFAIAGLLAEKQTIIEDAACAEISFPGFFALLEKIAYA